MAFVAPKVSKMSAEDIGKRFEENSFDAIICQHVIEHLLYPTNLATGIKKISVKREVRSNPVRSFK